MDLQARKPEADEAIDEVVRRTLHDWVGSAEPPDRVWRQISRQVTAGTARRHRLPRPGRLTGRLAPLMQGLAATALLLLMGMSLRPDLWQRAYLFGAGDRIQEIETATDVPTPTPQPPAELLAGGAELEDRDSLAVRWRSEQPTAKPAVADLHRQEREADLIAVRRAERQASPEMPDEIVPGRQSAEKPLTAPLPARQPSRQPYRPPAQPF